MTRLLVTGLAAGVLLLGCLLTTHAATFVLDFEGLQNLEPIANYYDGGLGGYGSGPGPDYDVTFGASSLAITDADAGGSGNIANEPSPSNVCFFLSGSVVANSSTGFDTGFSFYYCSINYNGYVTVYDGVNATGNVLANIALPAFTQTNPGDPNGAYSTWMPVGVTFAGTALSVDFGGSANQIAFDNMTFGSETPSPLTPELSSASLLLFGMLPVGLAAWRRRKS